MGWRVVGPRLGAGSSVGAVIRPRAAFGLMPELPPITTTGPPTELHRAAHTVDSAALRHRSAAARCQRHKTARGPLPRGGFLHDGDAPGHVGNSLPDCSATMYAAYQSGQFSSR